MQKDTRTAFRTKHRALSHYIVIFWIKNFKNLSHLHVTLRLHESAHDSVGHEQFSGNRISDHGWNNGMVGPFAWCNNVRVAFFEAKVVPAVLQAKTATSRNDSGSESHIIAVDERAKVSVFVGGRKVNSITLTSWWISYKLYRTISDVRATKTVHETR